MKRPVDDNLKSFLYSDRDLLHKTDAIIVTSRFKDEFNYNASKI